MTCQVCHLSFVFLTFHKLLCPERFVSFLVLATLNEALLSLNVPEGKPISFACLLSKAIIWVSLFFLSTRLPREGIFYIYVEVSCLVVCD